MLVDGVTKLRHFEFKSKEDQQAENHRKMFVAMAQDLRCVLIKLADRLHNMRTLKYMTRGNRFRKRMKPLRYLLRLPTGSEFRAIKWELEDIALRFLNPQQYYQDCKS